jgi:mannose-6-phosphate isomerase-like protein (cupin superfamily)
MTSVVSMQPQLAAFAFEPRRIDKPWGYELVWALSEDYCGKILFVEAGQMLSPQYHVEKDETIYLDRGLATIELGNVEGSLTCVLMHPGDAFRVRPRVVHRLRAIEDSVFLEASTPRLDDVVRIQDQYGRVRSG